MNTFYWDRQLCRNTGLRPHDFTQILYYSMSLDWQNLRELEGGGFVKLILILKDWCSVYYFEILRRVLTRLLMMSGSVIQTQHAILLIHSSSLSLQRPDSLGITHFFSFILMNVVILIYKPCHKANCLLKFLSLSLGAWGGEVVEVLRYLSDGPGIVSRWWHWIFQWHISFRPHQVSGIDSAPVENEWQECSWGLGFRCVRLNISPPSCTEYRENPGVLTSWNSLGHTEFVKGWPFILVVF